VCVLLPLGSWVVDGRGELAYTMYARTVVYRLDVTAIDATGARSPVDLARVATQVSSPAAPFIGGAGGFRPVATIDALRDHLADVARAACQTTPADAIEVTLYERPGEGEPDSEALPPRSERVRCPRSEG
jgi:hypothetical protein